MKKEQRLNIIKNILCINKKIHVSALANKFNVTERTIRRDIASLVKLGIASPFYGGASYTKINAEYYFESTGINNIMEKMDSIDNTLHAELPSRDDKVFILGSFNIDIVSELEDFPKSGETVRSYSTHFYAGGKGTNQAIAASKINDNVHLFVKVGSDEFGKKASNYLYATDIKTITMLEDKEKSTGNAVIFLSKKTNDNVIAINLGANENIKNSEMIAEFAEIKKSAIFLTQLENNFDITKAAVMHAHRSNVPVILNPAPFNESVKEILQQIDIITPNEIEAQGLSGIEIHSIEDAKRAAEVIYQLGVKVVVITLGSKGAVMFDGQTSKHYKAFKSVVIDTSGAGDSFNGALAACLAKKYSLDYAITVASAFASLAVERKGASNMPDFNLVKHRLESMQEQ